MTLAIAKPITIRPLHPTDHRDLHRTCWPQADPRAVDSYLERVTLAVSQEKAVAVVAEATGMGVVGYGQITRWPKSAEVSDLIVGEGWRNRGIGAALIRNLIAAGRPWGLLTVEIGVREANADAYRLYARLGFRHARRLCLDVGNGPEPIIYLGMPFN